MSTIYRFKYFISLFFIFLTITGMSPLKKNNYVFHYTKKPQFHFELPQFKNWTLSPRSETIIGYLPEAPLAVKFEYPPNVAVLLTLDSTKLRKPKIEKYGTNSQGVKYQKYYVEGFAKDAVKFEQHDNVVFILSVEDLPEHGLQGEIVEDTIIRTFKFD